MVALPSPFDASLFPPAKPFTFTVAASHTESRWTERRGFDFDELAELFTRAEIGPKQGSCYTPAIFTGVSRKMDAAERVDVVVLDSDAGTTLEEIEAAIRAKGWRAIVHSTHSHLTEHTEIAAAPYDKWIRENKGGQTEGYMLAKKDCLPRVVAGAEIVEELGEDGARSYIVHHNPCPKFRIILPLETPWLAENYESQGVATATWRERIGAVAYALGLEHDQSCVDASRLFFFPRRKPDQEFIFAVIDGEDCPLWSLPEARAHRQDEAPLFASVAPVPHQPRGSHKEVITPEGEVIDLTTWAAQCGSRFEIVKALKARAPHMFGSRRSGSKYHIECPNGEGHTSGAGDRTGTYCVNASELGASGLSSVRGFVIHCSHNGCAGRDRLDHLGALLSAGVLSADDLGNPDFLIPEAPLVDISALLAPKDIPAQAANEGNIAPHLYADLPGVMGEIHDYITKTSPKPQPVLNLGATLAFMASAIGQRVQLQSWGTRPNIYVLGIAHSGAGKERALSAIKQMAKAAGLFEDLIGVEDVASDSGIISSIVKQPRQIILLDEVSHIIATVNGKNAASHLAGVVGTLLKLYSSSSTTYKTKSYVDSEKTRVVEQPCASLYGCCTPSGLYSALSSKDITSGLLSRAVLFDAGDHDPYAAPPTQMKVPEAVTDWLKAWAAVNPIQNPVAMEGGLPVLEPRIVIITADAMAMIAHFNIEMHNAKAAARQSGTDSLYVRATENALKFALIRACAGYAHKIDGKPVIDEADLCVDAACMEWAIEVSRATVLRMEHMAKNEIADTDFQQRMRGLADMVRSRGREGATVSDMLRHRAGKMKRKDLEDVLGALVEGRTISYIGDVRENSKGRKRAAYVHKDFLKKGEGDD